MEFEDYGARLREYLRQWRKGEGRGLKGEALEAALPEVCERFLDSPAPWLGGVTPRERFRAFDDPGQLTGFLEEFLRRRLEPPEPLLARLLELGEASAAPLCALAGREGADPRARLLAVSLLNSLGSLQPIGCYIALQQSRRSARRDSLRDLALEGLEAMGEAAVGPMLDALPGATVSGKEALLSALSRFPGDERIFQGLMALFLARPGRQAVLAGYLARLGDPRALPALKRRAEAEGISYFDFIDLRSAIEALGGEVLEHAFYGDEEYERVFGEDA